MKREQLEELGFVVKKMTLRVLTTAEIRQAIESHNLWLIGC